MVAAAVVGFFGVLMLLGRFNHGSEFFPATEPTQIIVDLEMPGESAHPDWGSRQEMLAVYSLVDTVLLNLPDIKAVTLLRNGQQPKTFAGHIDTTHPLVADRNLLATRTQ